MRGRRHSRMSSLPLQIFSQPHLLFPCPASYSVFQGGEMLRSKAWCFSVHATLSWLGPGRSPSLVLCIYLLPFSLISHSYTPPPRTTIVVGLLSVTSLNVRSSSVDFRVWVCISKSRSVVLSRNVCVAGTATQDPSSGSQRTSSSRGDLLILHSRQGGEAHIIYSFNKKTGKQHSTVIKNTNSQVKQALVWILFFHVRRLQADYSFPQKSPFLHL